MARRGTLCGPRSVVACRQLSKGIHDDGLHGERGQAALRVKCDLSSGIGLALIGKEPGDYLPFALRGVLPISVATTPGNDLPAGRVMVV